MYFFFPLYDGIPFLSVDDAIQFEIYITEAYLPFLQARACQYYLRYNSQQSCICLEDHLHMLSAGFQLQFQIGKRVVSHQLPTH